MRLLAVFFCFLLLAVGHADRPERKRVRIPSWDTFPRGVFFEDAFAEALKGTRADAHIAKTQPEVKPNNESGQQNESGSAWSRVISPQTIEDEVKAIKIEIDKLVTTPSKFRSGAFKQVRLHFTVATLLFGIASEYGAPMRWQDVAAGTRDLFARAAANSKVGDIRAYNEAKNRKEDLHDLLSGARTAPPDPVADTTWDQWVDRSPLMQRLDIADTQRITVWIANDEAISKNQSRLQHEAEIVAAIALALQQKGMEDADDPSYVEYCEEMKNAALELVRAIKQNEAEAVRKSASNVHQSCDRCHEDYRG